MNDRPHVAVTIARQLGSGGSYLGHRIARRLGVVYLDREILYQTARALGVDAATLERREERVPGFWEQLVAGYALGSPEEHYVPPPIRPGLDDRFFQAEQQVMRRFAGAKDCVVVGRGGFHLLRGQARLVNVFVHAPRAFRLRRVVEFYRIGSDEAGELINRTDGDREPFIQ